MTIVDIPSNTEAYEDFETREIGEAADNLELQLENREWMESLDYILQEQGPERVLEVLRLLANRAFRRGVTVPFVTTTPYINTIPPNKEVPYPGDRDMERRIKSVIRWNALAMVAKANKVYDGIGGHISTFASSATLYEVGYNHFFHAKTDKRPGDFVFFQGHASPGMYARAYVEGRLPAKKLHNFRRELAEGGGLSSYPHPYLMPDFWQFPTVSMGLGPIMAIYLARFNRYLQDRGIVPNAAESKVWAFLGDGETDEPESLGAISLAGREKLDNLIFVINCNLQRLDGPVRGNGKIIQELETSFKGAGWNVVKVVWGSSWDKLLARDHDGLLVRRMEEVVDGEYQKYSVEDASYIREKFFGKYPELREMVNDMSDQELKDLRRGGLDPLKVYNGYKAAVETKDRPSVVLAKTVKGYGLGEAGEGQNVAHNAKKVREEALRVFHKRFSIPVPEEEIDDLPFYKFPEDSPEHKYIHEHRQKLGGYLPKREAIAPPLKMPARSEFESFFAGSGDKKASTTMVFGRILDQLLKNKEWGKNIVPIIPDEARTFGLDPLFSTYGIYSHIGQLYEPVDRKQLAYYKESTTGQVLEEGITEAGSMSSFIAAGCSYSTHGVNMMPFFIYYSQFGFQRIGDLVWAAGDMRCRGFMLGATAGRTTLSGEGLQHQDGHSLILANTFPTVRAYDPAFAFELAIIIQDGMKRMFQDQEDVIYYITLGNENYQQLPMPKGAEEGVLKGLYKFQSGSEKHKTKAHIFGSFVGMNAALEAQQILDEQFKVSADVWSATSYKALRYDCMEVERYNMLHPNGKAKKKSYLETLLENEKGPFVAVSDSMRLVSDQVTKWVPGGLFSLGTDGYGRSETRENLRNFFEVDAKHVVVAVLHQLAERGEIKPAVVKKAIEDLGVDAEQGFSLYR